MNRRSFLKWLGCLPFAGLLGLPTVSEEANFDTLDKTYRFHFRYNPTKDTPLAPWDNADALNRTLTANWAEVLGPDIKASWKQHFSE